MAVPLFAQPKEMRPCTVPAEGRTRVEHYLELASAAVAHHQDASAKAMHADYHGSQLLAGIAGVKVCLKDYREAARFADMAYPSGSEAENELGQAIAMSGSLAELPAIESSMKHGVDSLLYGVAEGLATKGDFEQADVWAKKIPAPEVRDGAQSAIVIALYKAGRKTKALQRTKESFDALDAKKKAHTTLLEVELDLALSAGDWSAAHHDLDGLPAGPEKRYFAATIASEEAEANAEGSHEDLLAAAAAFDAKQDPPFEGYMIASRLAGLHDLAAAQKAAEADTDDEWNQKAWASIASFQAEAGMLAEARASIARIGHGELVHKLDNYPEARDMAREFVAAVLTTVGKPDAALSLLAEHEDKDDIGGDLLYERVHALAAKGDFTQAQELVKKRIDASVVIGDRERNLAEMLVEGWYAASPSDAEKWISSQKSDELRAACWIALASAVFGEKAQARHYFVNWD